MPLRSETNPPIFHVDQEGFQSLVIEASAAHPILVDFHADWSGPSQALSPHLERAVNELDGAIRLARVLLHGGDNLDLARRYRLRSVPTVILFRDGQERGRFSGSGSTHQVRDWVTALLS